MLDRRRATNIRRARGVPGWRVAEKKVTRTESPHENARTAGKGRGPRNLITTVGITPARLIPARKVVMATVMVKRTEVATMPATIRDQQIDTTRKKDGTRFGSFSVR
jgi:hypothetical protein